MLRCIECLTASPPIPSPHIAQLSSLNEINLNFTNVSDTGVRQLCTMEQLEDIQLGDTLITKVGAELIKARFPNARLYWCCEERRARGGLAPLPLRGSRAEGDSHPRVSLRCTRGYRPGPHGGPNWGSEGQSVGAAKAAMSPTVAFEASERGLLAARVNRGNRFGGNRSNIFRRTSA